MLKIPWNAHVSNTEELNRMGKEVEMLYKIKRGKLENLGYVIRNEKYRFFQLITQGRIEGRSVRERKNVVA